jgi:hypothetical protein
MRPREVLWPSTVAQSCNSSYPKGRDWEDSSSRPARETPILINELGREVCVCNPSYLGGCRQKDHGLRSALGKIMRPYLKNS